MAAEQGDSEAQCSVGMIFKTIDGAEKNWELAEYWLTKSSSQGNSVAREILLEVKRFNDAKKTLNNLKSSTTTFVSNATSSISSISSNINWLRLKSYTLAILVVISLFFFGQYIISYISQSSFQTPLTEDSPKKVNQSSLNWDSFSSHPAREIFESLKQANAADFLLLYFAYAGYSDDVIPLLGLQRPTNEFEQNKVVAEAKATLANIKNASAEKLFLAKYNDFRIGSYDFGRGGFPFLKPVRGHYENGFQHYLDFPDISQSGEGTLNRINAFAKSQGRSLRQVSAYIQFDNLESNPEFPPIIKTSEAKAKEVVNDFTTQVDSFSVEFSKYTGSPPETYKIATAYFIFSPKKSATESGLMFGTSYSQKILHANCQHLIVVNAKGLVLAVFSEKPKSNNPIETVLSSSQNSISSPPDKKVTSPEELEIPKMTSISDSTEELFYMSGDKVYLRKTPEILFNNKIILLSLNEEVTKLVEAEGKVGERWVKIKSHSGQIGWVRDYFLNSNKVKLGKLIELENNIRSGPGINYELIGRPKKGTKIVLLEQTGKWWKIRYGNGNIGWTHKMNFKEID